MGLGIGGDTVARIRAVIDLDTTAFKRSLAESDAAMEESGGKMSKFAGVAKVAAVGGVAILAAGLYESVKAAANAQKAHAQLVNSLSKLGKGAGDAANHWQDLLDAQSRVKDFSEGDLTNSMAKLTTMLGSPKKAFDALQNAMNVSARTGKPLAATAIAIGKAYEGNTSGLSRYGIILPKVTTAEDQAAVKIKVHTAAVLANAKANGVTGLALVKLQAQLSNKAKAEMASAKATDASSSSESAAAALRKKYGGAAAAQAHTLGGEIGLLKNDVDLAAIAIGTKLLPPLTQLVGWLIKVANSPQAAAAMTVLGNVFSKVGADIRTAWNYVYQVFERNRTQIIGTIKAIQTIVTSVFHALAPIVKTTLGALANQIRADVTVIGDVLTVAMDVVQGKWGAAWQALQKVPGAMLHDVYTSLRGAVSIVGAIGSRIGGAIITGIEDAFTSLGGWIETTIKGDIPSISSIKKDVTSLLATGGRVTGGTPGRDSVPALLTPGEIVLNSSQQSHMRSAYGVDVGQALGFAGGGLVPHLHRGKKESLGAYRQRESQALDSKVQGRFGALDFQLQLAGRIASRDDSEGNYSGEIREIREITRQQGIRGREIALYNKARSAARQIGAGSLATGYAQSAAFIKQDMLDAADTLKGLRGQTGTSASDPAAAEIAAFLKDFQGIAAPTGGSAYAGPNSGSGVSAAGSNVVNVHLHGVSAVDSSPDSALRQAQFAAQAVFG